jgi:hypothetical protein
MLTNMRERTFIDLAQQRLARALRVSPSVFPNMCFMPR